MNENDDLQQLETEGVNLDSSALESEEVMEDEQEPETTEVTEPPVDAEKESLKAQLQLEKDRRNGVKADKNVLAKTLKGFMDSYGVSVEEAAEIAGIAPNDLKARIDNIETSDNPVAAFVATFDDLYVNKGSKAVLDEVYGTDTQPFVDAFAKHGLNDPELQEQLLNLEPTKALNFVVKHGKELLEEMGTSHVSTRKLAKENAALKAEIAALKAGDEVEPVQRNKKMPLSGFAGGAANGGGAGAVLLPKGMF